jgi:hypothetical protein
MGMNYIAVSKGSGKKVPFKTKAAMDAALKKGTHEPVKKSASKKAASSGTAVFNGKPKKVFPKPKKTTPKADGPISKWDSFNDKVVTFKTKADFKKAEKDEFDGRYQSIHTGKESPVNVSSVITNGKLEAEFYDTISSWTNSTDMDEAKKLAKMSKIFDVGKKKLPKVFKPDVPPGKPVFRGLDKLNPKIESWIKTTKREDWKPVTDKELKKTGKPHGEWFVYTGPTIKQFTYTPHRPAQSWTTSSKVAFGFGAQTAILAMPLDDDFYFSSKYMDKFGYGENEVIRLGTKSSKPKLILNSRILNKLAKG